MATYKAGVTNNSSFGFRRVLTATDQSAATITINFESQYRLAYSIFILDSSNNPVALTGATITQATNGQITIANGGGFSLTTGYQLNIIASVDSSIYTRAS